VELHDVLYVPSFNGNLFSIAQLINDLFCVVTFTHKLCVTWDYSMKSPIGIGEQRIGDFFIKDVQPESIQVNKVTTSELWHRRLGQLSQQHMSLLSNSIGNFDNESSVDVCDMYFRAK